MQSPRKIIFINSHAIQYFAPLYKYLNEHGLVTECWYCSDENVKGHHDRQFNTKVEWDIPLLEGYPYRFFRNRSWKPSLYNGFFGLINPGILIALWRAEKSVVVVHGWNYFTHVMCLIVGRLAGHSVCLRGESPLNQELLKSPVNRMLKKITLRNFLFLWVNHFLYIGTQNKKFYEYYGVSTKKLSFAPYAVDNARFGRAASVISKEVIRKEFGLPSGSRVILFSAKFILKKRPMDLLRAFQKLELEDKCLLMVGDGELRSSMEEFVRSTKMSNVIFPGFVNQSEIVKYYAAADVFVLCSGEGETWGLSVNEALNFNLPVVVSDTAGCAEDLAIKDVSGLTFETGSVDALASSIRNCLRQQGLSPAKVVSRYSFSTIAETLATILRRA